jgi:CysZ protein
MTFEPNSRHPSHANTPLANSGAGYFMLGFQLIRLKGIRRFVFIPLSVNLILFSIAFYYVFQQFNYYMSIFHEIIPDWLSWLDFIIWPVAILALLVIFSFIFSTVANWLAAPFNGLLAEKLEIILSEQHAPTGNWLDVLKDTPRTLGREWRKLVYYVPRAIGFFLLMWLLPLLGQIIWLMFTAWMMAIQYQDYPFDNHKVPFHIMKAKLKQHQARSYSFGLTVAICSMIPLLNLVVMPVAICGATALWVDHYRQQFASSYRPNCY